MKILRLTLLAIALLLPGTAALAQSSPGWTYRFVPSPAQWNAAFAAKQDVLGFTPLNRAGGTMTGPLVTPASTSLAAGFNIQPGAAPSVPNNGDMWVTSAGLYVRINGATVGPLVDAATGTFVGQQTTTGSTTTSPGWYAGLTADTVPRVRVGLNASDIASLAFGPGNANRDAFLERLAAASLRFGAPDAAAPVAQTLGVQNVVTGTSNTAGAAWTLTGSRGTGNAAGGDIIFQIAAAGGSGSTPNALVNALHVFGLDGGVTIGSPTGGDKGVGTVNAAGFFVNGNAVASSVSAPLALNASTGALSITGAAGQVLAGSGPAFTATPTLGVAGSTLGSLAFANLTSGSIIVQPPTGALGSVTLTLPDVTDTLAPQGYLGAIRYVLTGVNFNATNTDNAVTITLPPGITRYKINNVFISNASASISTATAGVFTSTGGGGQTIAATQALTVTATAANTINNMMTMTITNGGIEAYNSSTLQFRVVNPEGSGATADVIIIINPLS